MENKTFWGHLEVLRWVIIRCAAVVFVVAVTAFCFKDFVFGRLILAPCDTDFVTYRLLSRLGLAADIGHVELININLAAQLMTHLSVSFYLAVVVAFPYLVTELWFFVKPALYATERRPAAVAVVLLLIV